MNMSKTPASADIVVGLGWGDEGKGATVDFLAHQRKANRVVRFNGGQQAAHNVIVNGKHHTFASFGSGTFSFIPTYIADYCTVDPIAAEIEATILVNKRILHRDMATLYVHENALITTPLHVMQNQIVETGRGDARHGSTGTGFGETVGWEYYGHTPLEAKDVHDIDKVYDFMVEYARYHGLPVDTDYLENASSLMVERAKQVIMLVDDDMFLSELSTGHTVFEGAQGFMLDEAHGTAPHTTWSTTTTDNALELASVAGIDMDNITKWGVSRTYATRHGAGPLPGEGIVKIEEPHNEHSEWAGHFRTGAWDIELLKQAILVNEIDKLSVTWADRFNGFMTTEGLIPMDSLNVNVGMLAHGPSRNDRFLV